MAKLQVNDHVRGVVRYRDPDQFQRTQHKRVTPTLCSRISLSSVFTNGFQQAEFFAMSKFVILDRDGVINRVTRGEYITSPEMIDLLPGAARAIAQLNARGYSIIVVSNQQCVALGLLTCEGLDLVSESLRAVLLKEGGYIEAFYYCTHLKTDACDCRKPQPGLLLEAQRRFGFDLAATYFVGDMYSDVLTAKNAGCRSIFALGGLDDELHQRGEPFPHAPEYVARDLADAVAYILAKDGGA